MIENMQRHDGVPAVLVQKTTILWKCLYLLASLKASSGLGGVYETNRSGGCTLPISRLASAGEHCLCNGREASLWHA